MLPGKEAAQRALDSLKSRAGALVEGHPDMKFRILLMGKQNNGKSTLCNKVLGIKLDVRLLCLCVPWVPYVEVKVPLTTNRNRHPSLAIQRRLTTYTRNRPLPGSTQISSFTTRAGSKTAGTRPPRRSRASWTSDTATRKPTSTSASIASGMLLRATTPSPSIPSTRSFCGTISRCRKSQSSSS